MFKYRIISFPLLLALVGAIFFWKDGGKYLFALIAIAGSGAVLFEAAQLFDKIKIKNYPLLCAAAGALISAAFCIDKFEWFSRKICCTAAAGITAALGIISLLMMITKKNKAIRRISGSIGVLTLIGIPFFLLENIYFRTVANMSLLLYVICVVKSMDTGGYIFGMLSAKLLPGGNHKIAPSISPKKSWEGVAGGMLLSVAASLIFCHFYAGNLITYIIHGVILSLLSLAGDLTESSLKRSADVKDSAHWIPGMGGVFDVFDSFLYVGYFMLISNL